MAFLDEVDSLRAKAGLSKARIPVLIGVGLLAVLVLAAAGYFIWGAVSSPGVVVTTEDNQDSQETEETESTAIFVHVAGAVQSPGMYELPEGSRVQDAITAAGGFSADAIDTSINLARALEDGEQIVVASSAEEETSSSESDASTTSGVVNGKVNINTADAETLMTLDGIGEVTAAKIIAYREANGSFSTTDELMEVPGIGTKKYEAIVNSITV